MQIDLRRAEPDSPWVIRSLLAGTAVLFAVLAIGHAAHWAALTDLDHRVARSAYDFSASRRWFVHVLDAIADTFSTLPVTLVLVAVVGWAAWRQELRLALWVAVSGLTVLVGNPLLKAVFARERPHWALPLNDIGGYSFPSGHSSGAAMLCTVLAMVTIVLTGRGLRRRLLLALLVVVAVGVAASRVLLGVHYVTDVLAGLSFGLFATLAWWLVLVHGTGRPPVEAVTVTGTGGRVSAVVLNPAKVGDVALFKDKVRQVAAMHQWPEPLWYETTIEDPGYGQARAALETGVDLVIAAGGDGTVRAVCEEAARTGVAVGILPHGTGNLLARNLDIPVNTRDALDVVFGGQDRAIDLASFGTDATEESTSFLVMAGMGLDAAIMTGVNDDLKSKVGYAAYFVSGVRAAMFPRTKVTITVDDEEPQEFRARTVVVGNVGFLQGGIPLLPDALIDDGVLDVVVIAPKRLFGWIPIAWRIVTRRPQNNERLSRLSGRRIHVVAEKDVPMQLDGDPVGEGRELTAEVSQGVVLVRVPA